MELHYRERFNRSKWKKKFQNSRIKILKQKYFAFGRLSLLVAKFCCKILFIYKHSSKADYTKGE